MSTILFPGRFDKPHTGHIITIQRLGSKYDLVIVCVLDYLEARYELSMRISILSEALHYSKGNYLVISNKKHFARITAKELDELPSFHYFGSGNTDVLMRMGQLIPESSIVNVLRYPGYAASVEEE